MDLAFQVYGEIAKPLDGRSKLLRIAESGWRDTPEGLMSSYGNCTGWTQMLCCLEVYVEHGVNLRAFYF